MSINNIDQPSPKPQLSGLPGLFDMRQLPFTRAELIETFPVVPPSPEIQTRNITDVVRQSTTRSGEHPYQNADVKVQTFSPDQVAESIRPVTTYLDSTRLRDLYYQDITLRSTGIDMFGLNDVVIYSENGQDKMYIAPPVVECNPDGSYSVVDGHHRLYLAMLYGISVKVAVVDNYDPEHRNPYQPLNWNAVVPAPVIPADLQKHILLPGHSETDLVEMSLAGDRGSRKHGLPKEAPFFHQNPIEKITLGEDTKQVLLDLNIEKLFPTVFVDKGLAFELLRVEDTAIPLGSDHMMITLHIRQKDTGQEFTFRPIAERKGVFGDRGRLIVTGSSDENYENISNQGNPANEVHLPANVRQEINRALSDRNLKQIVETDSLNQKEGIPQATGFELVDDNPYFSVLILNFDNQTSQIFKINHRDQKGQSRTEGTIYVVRNQNGDIILIDQDRPLFGMKIREAPRQFGYNNTQVKKETGIEVNTDDTGQSIGNIPGNRDVDIVTAQVMSVKIEESVVIPDGPDSSIKNVIISDEKCHKLIAKGEIPCEYTVAAVTLEQLHSGRLIINSDTDIQNKKIVLEKFYSPLEDKYYLRPPRVETGAGRRYGKNSFTDTGSCLEYNHTEIGDINSLPRGKYYETFTVTQIVDLMLSGQLDSTAMAHLSRVLRSQNMLILA